MSDDQTPSTTSSSSSTSSSETGYTFTSDPWIRWRNTFRYLTGQLTPEGNRQYKQGRDERYAEADCKRCEDQRDYLLQYSTLFAYVPYNSEEWSSGLNTYDIARRPDSTIYASEDQ